MAIIDNSAVTSVGNVGLAAISSATIDALTLAGGIAAAGGQGGGFSFAGAGAGSGNTIKNPVKAAISDGSTVTTTGTGAVSLTATDTSKIIADAGGAAIAAAGGQGGGASISVGISIADNEIGNQVLAVIDASAASKNTSGAADDCPETRRTRDWNRLTVISETATATSSHAVFFPVIGINRRA